MIYTPNTFLKTLSTDDRLIQILDTSNNVTHTIDPFSVVNVFVSNNILKIGFKDKITSIAFSSISESKQALPLIQEQIIVLKQKNPLYVDKKIENYVDSQNLQGPQGFQGLIGPQGSSIGGSSQSYYDNGTSSIVDFSNGDIQKILVDSNKNLSFSNPVSGKKYTLILEQNSDSFKSVSWPNDVQWESGYTKSISRIGLKLDKALNDNMVNAPKEYISVIKTQSDGKILVGGEFDYFYEQKGKIVRILENGELDTNFVAGFNDVEYGRVRDIGILSNDKIVAVGSFGTYRGVDIFDNIIVFNSDGSIDNSFILPGSLDNDVLSVNVQQDDKIVIGGWFTTIGTFSCNGICRLNSNGDVDYTFINNIGNGTGNDPVFSVDIQPDGKILLVGQFSTFNGATAGRICRLNSDGTLDTNFVNNTGTGFDGNPEVVKYHSGINRIIVGGQFNTLNGATYSKLVVLNNNGTVDTSFMNNMGYGPNSEINKIEIDSSNKIIVSGFFDVFSSNTVGYIAILNTDGTISSEKVRGYIDVSIYALEIDNNDNILIGGYLSIIDKERVVGYSRLLRSTPTIHDTFELIYDGSRYYISKK